jgi:hypothetical protein
MHKAARSASSDFWGQEVSSRLEELTRCKGVLHSTKPFLIHFRKQAWKPLLGVLPFPLRDLKPHARSGLDLGRDDHIDRNPMKQPPVYQLHPLDRLGIWIPIWSPVMKM